MFSRIGTSTWSLLALFLLAEVAIDGQSDEVGTPCVSEQVRLSAEYENRQWSSKSIHCSLFVSNRNSTYFEWREFVDRTVSNTGVGVEGGRHSPWGLVSPDVVRGLDAVREEFGGPLVITSGYRCPKGNSQVAATVGSDPGPRSPHIFGKAVDFRPTGGKLTSDQHEKLLNAIVNSRGTVAPRYREYSKDLTHIHASW